MKRMRNVLKIATVIPFIILLVSCNNRVGNSEKSHTLLAISKLTGTTAAGDEADFTESDVYNEVDLTVVADVATATLTAKLIEPEPPATGPSFKQNVILTRYTVSFTLSDGTGVPGVDVPLPFEGSLSSIIEVDSSTEVSFVLVPAAAKLAAPLIGLVGGVQSIQAKATVTIYGQDVAGNDIVPAKADISIFFADYKN
jgi:hypothetical protein